MLIYNHEKELLGIDAKDLDILGFSTLAQLKTEVSDFADLFVKKPGFVHNFQHVHWIDFVKASDDNSIFEVIISAKNKEYQASLQIESIYLSDEPSLKAYIIYLQNLREVGSEIKKDEKIFIEKEFEEFDDDIPIDIEKETETEIEEEIEEEITTENNYEFDSELASKDLGLPADMVEEFIQDFVKESNKNKENLYSALEINDLTTVKTITHKLKGVSANLRIDDIFEILSSIKTSDNSDEIKNSLDLFYKKIEKLTKNTNPIEEISEEEIENTPDLSDDIFLETDNYVDNTTPIEINEEINETLEIMYDKDLIAKKLGISTKNFEELFNDFIDEAKNLSNAINDAILENNSDVWTIEAIKLKGLSENMYLDDLKKELEKIIHTTDKDIVQESINKIDLTINNISKI
ncbi:MAG: Hpt domain-containing protein [Campylobacterota bacterium]|nr:Hpt domain-containing protein [Campylobacterota bacterium]